MRPLTRGGFTLVELLTGLLLLAFVAGVVVTIVRGAGGVATRTLMGLAADRTILSFRAFLQEELRDGQGDDVALLAPARLGMLRQIGEATPCADSGGALLIADRAWRGTRLPQGSRDDALLLTDPVAETWLRLSVDSVTTDRCPGAGATAFRLNVAPHGGTAVIVRIIEPVELSAYRSGTADWFGLTPASGASAVQPFAGPLVLGSTRFNWFSDRLDATFSPRNAGAATVSTPLAPP